MKNFFSLLLILCLLPLFPLAQEIDRSALSIYEDAFIIPVQPLTEVPDGFTGIYSAADLQKIKDDSAGKYILMNDIYLTGDSLRMVGFTGELDGNGYTIFDLNINIALNPRDTYYVGFFGWIRDAVIRNLRVEGDITIVDNGFKTECRAYVGGITGRVFGNSTLYNCVSNVNITYEDAVKRYLAGYYGGIAGALDCEQGSTIQYCHNIGIVFGPERVGGIIGCVGAAPKGSPVAPAVYACLNDGVVDSLTWCAGGIVGDCGNNTSPGSKALVISNCVNRAEIFALSGGGGILGRADDRDSAGYTVIEDCLNLGLVVTRDSPVSPVGGIVGVGDCYVTRCINYGKLTGNPQSAINTDVSDASFLKDNYYLDTVDYACLPTDRHIEITEGKLTAEQMKLKESFPALNFESVWEFDPNTDCPYPKAIKGIIANNLEAKFAELREMFPSGKYWNHVGISYEEYAANREKYNATYTDYPCDASVSLPGVHRHGGCSPSYETGQCGCNTYDGSIQCMGFARYIGNYLTGVSTRDWEKVITYSSIASIQNQLQPGDYIRFGTDTNGHSAIVVSADENGVYLLECNYSIMNSGKNCQIVWTSLLPWTAPEGYSSISARFVSKDNQGYILRYQK